MDQADAPPERVVGDHTEERMEHGEQVHLLLSVPGQPPASLPASPWRGWLPTDRGPVDPATAAKRWRLSPVSPRAERALVAAVVGDDVDALVRSAAQDGPVQDAARILAALRLATVDATAAIDLLHPLTTSPTDPCHGKVVRKHWSALTVQVDLAPGVPALVGLGRSAFGLLAAELMVAVGRLADALALLETLPPRPPVVLAKAAALLAHGDHARVLEVTAALPGTDDVSALALVARSVAARSQQDISTALDAVGEALDDSRRGAVLAAALEERAHLYTLAGDAAAAHADMEALAAVTGGRSDVAIPPPSPLRRPDEPREDDPLDRARKRIARRITGVGAPGTFGGRHHSTYRDEIATMFALGQVDAVEELLLGLLDVVEDEVDELGVALDATFFLTLADLYQDSGRSDDLVALRERYAAADARAARRATDVTVDDDSADADGGEAGDPFGEPVGELGEEPGEEPTVGETDEAVPEQPVAVPAFAGSVLVPDAVSDVSATSEPAAISGDELDLVDPTRELTPVERAVRGPRVRSL